MAEKSNLVLIGMPGSGKSTLGKRLAVSMGLTFIDTDAVIEAELGMSLQTIVERRSYLYLRQIESQILSGLSLDRHVIATGGSAVYSGAAMRNLATNGCIVYLSISLPTLLKRVNNINGRGLAKKAHLPLAGLYFERRTLYQQWADVTVKNDWPITGQGYARQLDQIMADCQV